MDLEHLEPQEERDIEKILGYLNFSSGSPDPGFLCSINDLFAHLAQRADCEQADDAPLPAWRQLGQVLGDGLNQVANRSEAFRQADQARGALALLFDSFLPAYRRHHCDLLYHQTEESLFQPLFIGRACEVVLAEGPPWDEADRIVRGAMIRLNDYIGHRPVAVLRTAQKIQPYAHEWVRPIPLFIQGAGVAYGPYHELIEKTLEILQSTDPDLLRQAWFDPAMLDELALDPRACDFDHPVNRRRNHHFGGWDPHHIDNRGFYRRFVLQQVTLDALRGRVEQSDPIPRDQRLFEAAAVLAGTMLMGSGISGSGPDSHDSGTTLATLLPQIAAYRDVFYEQLLDRIDGAHAERLRAEARSLRQPFGGARQHLNQTLARRRAEQLQHVRLAQLFARMGYIEAAGRQAAIVPVASARMRCEIQCRLTTAHLDIDQGRLDDAAALLPQIEDLLNRAIQCGALVDPWNILGFGGQFSLFPAVENSVHDHRVDELIDLMGEIFTLYARLEKEAAAAGLGPLEEKLSSGLQTLARWWDKFGSTEISDIHGISGAETWESAQQVATALVAWREAGTAAGDVAFWRQHVDQFRSPKAYALLVQSLSSHHDPVAAMALLIHWLGQADMIPLDDGGYSFFRLALNWMGDLWRPPSRSEDAMTADQRWSLARKFLDYLEANAEQYWRVPRLELAGQSGQGSGQSEEEMADAGLFGAAYENVTYRDTTDDGFDGSLFQGQPATSDTELTLEAERIGNRLLFLAMVAQLWKLAAVCENGGPPAADRDDVLAEWLGQAMANSRQLRKLLDEVHHYPIPPSRGTHDALIEYDRHRAIRDSLQERIVMTAVEMADAARMIRTTMRREASDDGLEPWEAAADRVIRAVFRGDVEEVRAAWPELIDELLTQPLLYVPIARGGNPQRIANSRNLQRVFARLLRYLPRLGLLVETFRLIQVIQDMERRHPAGPGAVTEFDRLFEIGCRSIMECLVVSSEDWPKQQASGHSAESADLDLIESLEQAVELLLECWLAHSRNIRISVLESVANRTHWRSLKHFIQHYGGDLFTQRFMNLANLRAILHQGVDAYIESLQEEPGAEGQYRILQDLGEQISRREAVRWLELTIEAVVENYAEYVDYNSTTTQSDRGDLLYTLLDFLRIEASYDRVAWNLKPVAIVHEVLVRQGRDEAGVLWQRAVARRSAEVADDHLERLARLSRRYGMRLPSIASRLRQRFVQPLAIDRLRALIQPAIQERRDNKPPIAFELLEHSLAQFTDEPSGVGFDAPYWLEALEEEVHEVRFRNEQPELPDLPPVPQVKLSRPEVERQMEQWTEE